MCILYIHFHVTVLFNEQDNELPVDRADDIHCNDSSGAGLCYILLCLLDF